MPASKFTQSIAALTVFFTFIYIASHQRPSGKPILSSGTTGRVTPDISLKPVMRERDFRELALELPDSLLPFERGVLTNKEISLSFDACPTGGRNHFDKAVFKVLQQTHTPATVFVSGKWVEEDSNDTRLLASDSLIELANHSFSHPHLTSLSVEKVRKELQRTQTIISNLTGQVPLFFRAPYGELNDSLINTARQMGLVTVQFDVESGDPDTSFTAERLIKWVTKKTRNGSVIIMHINNRGWHTAEALPSIIAELEAKGFTFVKVSALLKQVIEERKSDSPGLAGSMQK